MPMSILQLPNVTKNGFSLNFYSVGGTRTTGQVTVKCKSLFLDVFTLKAAESAQYCNSLEIHNECGIVVHIGSFNYLD